jgi:hypothetical protein
MKSIRPFGRCDDIKKYGYDSHNFIINNLIISQSIFVSAICVTA